MLKNNLPAPIGHRDRCIKDHPAHGFCLIGKKRDPAEAESFADARPVFNLVVLRACQCTDPDLLKNKIHQPLAYPVPEFQPHFLLWYFSRMHGCLIKLYKDQKIDFLNNPEHGWLHSGSRPFCVYPLRLIYNHTLNC